MIRKTFHWGHGHAKNLWSDSLYRNSFWLMAAQFIGAGIGFFYWIIAARTYTPRQIGLATALLSAASIINGLSNLGFGMTLIRYLSGSAKKENEINTAFTISAVMAAVLGLIYLWKLSIFSPEVIIFTTTFPALLVLFIFFPINAINGITDSVFTALREAHWVFLSILTQSIVKLIAILLLVGLGAWGVLGSNILGVFAAFVFCTAVIGYKYSIQFKPEFNKEVFLKVKKFALANYIYALISTIPSLLMPILITNLLSAEQAAYYYMPSMLGGLFTVIPATISRSYFTESSYSGEIQSIKKPLTFCISLLLPSMLFIIIFGSTILQLFGKGYAAAGYELLVLIMCGIFISSLNYFLSYQQLILDNLRFIIFVQVVSMSVYLGTVFVLSPVGILSVGIGTVLSQITSAMFFGINYFYNRPNLSHAST